MATIQKMIPKVFRLLTKERPTFTLETMPKLTRIWMRRFFLKKTSYLIADPPVERPNLSCGEKVEKALETRNPWKFFLEHFISTRLHCGGFVKAYAGLGQYEKLQKPLKFTKIQEMDEKDRQENIEKLEVQLGLKLEESENKLLKKDNQIRSKLKQAELLKIVALILGILTILIVGTGLLSDSIKN